MAATWATWPLGKHLTRGLATHPGHAGTVPMFNAWTLWWNAESLAGGLTRYWDAPIFFPASGTFALSEPQPILMLLAPLVWIFDSPIVASNLYLIGSLVLNGLFAMRVLRTAKCNYVTQLSGGMAMLLHPLALENIEAAQLLPMWPFLWTLDAFVRFQRKSSWPTGAELGFAFSTIGLVSVHQLLLASLTLLGSVWFGANWRNALKKLVGLAASVAVAVCVLGPLLVPMQAIHQQYSLKRDAEVVQSLSASPETWLTRPNGSWLPTGWLLPTPTPEMFPHSLLPGIVRSGLAVACTFYCRRQRELFGRLLGAVVFFSILLSFGPNLRIGEWSLWQFLTTIVEPLGRVRSPYRFAYFAQAAIILMASFNVDSIWKYGNALRFLRSRPAGFRYSREWGASQCLLAGLLFVAVALESWPGKVRLVYPPQPAWNRNVETWIDHLKAGKAAGVAVVCLPIAENLSEAAQEQETIWMMYATQHRRPIANGYSGYTPSVWQRLQRELNAKPIAAATFRELYDTNIRMVVVREDRIDRWLDEKSISNESLKLTLEFSESGFQVWQLSPE